MIKIRHFSNRKKGWTFIETLVVMAIVMVLTASVGISSVKQIDKARVVTARSQIETLCMALDSYYLDKGCFPEEREGLDALWSGDLSYVSKPVKKDPWGNDYVYIRTENRSFPYRIISYGKDGVPGGEGVESDISSF